MACRVLVRNNFIVFYSLIAFGLASASFIDDQPYCALRYRRLCQGKGHHVGCQYPHPGPGVDCWNYTQIKFTDKLRHFIISYINRRRQRVASGTERARGGALIPKPQLMMMVVWDRELAMLAQRLADQCSFIHDDCRATVRYPYSGQTVGEVRWRGTTGESDTMSAQRAIRRVFDAWWGERRRVQPKQLTAPFKVGTRASSWGHFSQLAVWALAAAGCGAVRHGDPRRLLLVCDFSHTNMLGQSTLIPGDLAPCPPHFVRKSRSPYPLLCTPIRVPEQSGSEDNPEYGTYEEYAPKFPDAEDDVTSSVRNKKVMHTTLWTETEKSTERTYKRKFKNTTKPFIMEKLEEELEAKSSTQYIASRYVKKMTSLGYLDELGDNDQEEFNLKTKFKMNTKKPFHHSAEEITTEMLRRKWKQSRQRPRRPGADALINKPVENVIRRSSVASLRLDRDDLEQLFQDTGFHRHWKTDSLP